MKKGILLIIAGITGILLTGCGSVSKDIAKLTGYDIVCVHGVNYIQFSSGVSVMYNQDGTISKCEIK